MSRKDEFSPKIIKAIKSQSAYICSNPDCRVMTLAPSIEDELKFIYIGEVSHITAASQGGPRYDKDDIKRKEIENAIFLCKTCATMIDKNNGVDFSVSKLKDWKITHLEWVRENLNKNASQAKKTFISQNQQGGIFAETVNVYSPMHSKEQKTIDHDKEIFKLFDQVWGDEKIQVWIQNLTDSGKCYLSDLDSLDKLILFIDKIQFGFITDEIQEKKLLLKEPLIAIQERFNANFDKYPLNQPPNFKVQLMPYLLRDNPYQNESTMNYKLWQEMHVDFLGALNEFKIKYNDFRKEVKRNLHI